MLHKFQNEEQKVTGRKTCLGQVGGLSDTVHTTEGDDKRPPLTLRLHHVPQNVHPSLGLQDLHQRLLQSLLHCRGHSYNRYRELWWRLSETIECACVASKCFYSFSILQMCGAMDRKEATTLSIHRGEQKRGRTCCCNHSTAEAHWRHTFSDGNVQK